MTRAAIIDTGLSNIDSIRRAVEECGGSVSVADSPAGLRKGDRIILPGVGAFTEAMSRLRSSGLADAIGEAVLTDGSPFLGICLGMQLMAAIGTEGGRSEGLGWIPATVKRLVPTGTDRRVPHVGWNEVHPSAGRGLFDGIAPGTDFYFVHSFHVTCERHDDIAATTPYCGGFAAAVGHDVLWGVQFHPEKSQKAGFRLLSNFLSC